MTGGAAVTAEVLAIGDELLHGVTVDTNSAWIARELELSGVEVRRVTVAGDAPGPLRAAIAEACARATVVVASGGLGPTEDDRTRSTAAAAAGVELAFDAAIWQDLVARFAQRNLVPPDSNRLQAWMPAGSDVLANDWGTAPGFALRIGRAEFFALPGVPREMKKMFQARVLPRLAAVHGPRGAYALHELHVLGLHEAQLGERIAGFMRPDRDPRVGVTARDGMLTVRVVGHGADCAAAAAACEATAAELRPRLGSWLLYEGEIGLAAALGAALVERGVTVATAESCTGGMVAQMLTAVPGISAVLHAGLVVYANDAKVALAGVPRALLETHGAVSAEVAGALAAGAARAGGARLGLSTTGVAGPGGGSEDKPVGTVWFGLCLDGEVTTWQRRIPDLGRAFIRARASVELLAAALRRVREA